METFCAFVAPSFGAICSRSSPFADPETCPQARRIAMNKRQSFLATGFDLLHSRICREWHFSGPAYRLAESLPVMMSDESWNSESWSSSGSGNYGSIIERLEFIIHPDGRVEERVYGVKGRSCEEVTKEIEEQLGKVTHSEKTGEFWEKETIKSEVDQKLDMDPDW